MIDEVVDTYNFQQKQREKGAADETILNGKNADVTRRSSKLEGPVDSSDDSDIEHDIFEESTIIPFDALLGVLSSKFTF
jgi:hypothetical protein